MSIMQSGNEIRTGCCGFVVSQQNYFGLFRLIEIQQTFYQLPRLQTAEKWRRIAPQGFEFTIKAWQLITHESTSPTYRRLGKRIPSAELHCYGRFQPTEEVMEAWKRTAVFARALGATVIVFQCPASFGPSSANVAGMRQFFSGIDREDLRFAWEPRGAWPDRLVLELCRDLELVHCVDPFKNKPQYGDLQYFRLHGITGYAYRYTDANLQKLKVWADEKPTYVLFNNNWMKDDALRFMALTQTALPNLCR